MKCICLRTCSLRINDRSIFFSKDQIADFDECPEPHFAPIDKTEIDFNTATLALLLQSDNWTIADAVDYLAEEYGVEPSEPLLNKKEAAKLVIDTRNRKVTLPNED